MEKKTPHSRQMSKQNPVVIFTEEEEKIRFADRTPQVVHIEAVSKKKSSLLVIHVQSCIWQWFCTETRLNSRSLTTPISFPE